MHKIEHLGPNSTIVRFPEVRKGWEQWILLRSDAHHDNPHCNWKLEKKHLDQAKEYDALIIDAGDLFCAMQGKFDKRGNKDSIRPEHEKGNYLDRLVDTAAEFYRPYAKQFVILGRGNHETAIRGRHETDLTDRLAAELRRSGSQCIAGGYGGFVRFQFTINKTKRTSRLLHYFHGSGGGGHATRGVPQSIRVGAYTPDADILLTGHTHDSWIVPIARQRINDAGNIYHDEQYHVRCGGYKDAWGDGSSGFEVEKMLGPKPQDAAWIRFYYEVDSVQTEILRAT